MYQNTSNPTRGGSVRGKRRSSGNHFSVDRGRGKRKWAHNNAPFSTQPYSVNGWTQQRMVRVLPGRSTFYFPARYSCDYFPHRKPEEANPPSFRTDRLPVLAGGIGQEHWAGPNVVGDVAPSQSLSLPLSERGRSQRDESHSGVSHQSSLRPRGRESESTSQRSQGQSSKKRQLDISSNTFSEIESNLGDRQSEDVEDHVKLPQFDVNKDKASFYMQSVRFYSEVHLTKKDEEVRKMVQEDIYKVFERALPNLRVWTFGSVYTGLASRSSDMDIFLESSITPSREFVKNNGFLVKRSPKFKDVIVIAQARVPIIKATHVATGIEVDINATSKQSLLTSVIIKFLMSGNSRAKRLTMLINYWAKLNRLIGSNKLTSYLFCILTIFYLQQLDPPILPSVSKLLESSDWASQHPYWVRLDASLLDSQSMIESHSMFEGFFKYYSNFDFASNVISCYLGKPIPVADLETQSNLPEEMSGLMTYLNDTKFPVGEINIQDLCELHVNKTHSLVPRFVLAFKMSLTRVAETLSGLPDSEWLRAIFSQPPVEIAKNPKKKVISKSFELIYSFDEEDWFVTFQRDLEFTLNLLLVKWNTVSSDSASFKMRVNTEYSVFGKKFKRIVPALLNGELTVEEFPSRVKIIVDRIAKPDTRLEAELLATVVGKGRVLLTFTEMCELTCLSMFSSYIMHVQTTLEKLLVACHLKFKL